MDMAYLRKMVIFVLEKLIKQSDTKFQKSVYLKIMINTISLTLKSLICVNIYLLYKYLHKPNFVYFL